MTLRRLTDCEGTAEPGTRIRLLWNQKVLGETTADADGRWRFALANFPGGQHRLLVESSLPGRTATSNETFFTVDEPRVRTAGKPSAPVKKPVKRPLGK